MSTDTEQSDFERLAGIIASEGPNGITEALDDAFYEFNMDKIDLSDGDATVMIWRTHLDDEMIEVEAISLDNISFDFALRRFALADRRDINFGGIPD